MKFIVGLIIFYLILLLARYLFRWWLLRKQRQFAEQFGGQGGAAYKQYTWGGNTPGNAKNQPRKKEGEVRVESTGATQKKVNRSVGDYVEYEEVAEIEYEETK